MKSYAVLDTRSLVVLIFEHSNSNQTPPSGFTSWRSYFESLHNSKVVEIGAGFGDQKRYPEIGDEYSEFYDTFSLPKPFESWIQAPPPECWVAPVMRPNDGNSYAWNEDLLEWELTAD